MKKKTKNEEEDDISIERKNEMKKYIFKKNEKSFCKYNVK